MNFMHTYDGTGRYRCIHCGGIVATWEACEHHRCPPPAKVQSILDRALEIMNDKFFENLDRQDFARTVGKDLVTRCANAGNTGALDAQKLLDRLDQMRAQFIATRPTSYTVLAKDAEAVKAALAGQDPPIDSRMGIEIIPCEMLPDDKAFLVNLGAMQDEILRSLQVPAEILMPADATYAGSDARVWMDYKFPVPKFPPGMLMMLSDLGPSKEEIAAERRQRRFTHRWLAMMQRRRRAAVPPRIRAREKTHSSTQIMAMMQKVRERRRRREAKKRRRQKGRRKQ